MKREWLRSFGEVTIVPQPVFTEPSWATDIARQVNDSEAQARRIWQLQTDIRKNGQERCEGGGGVEGGASDRESFCKGTFSSYGVSIYGQHRVYA